MSDELLEAITASRKNEAKSCQKTVPKYPCSLLCPCSLEDRVVSDAQLISDLRDALRYFRDRGCPDCGGDCASANPPVNGCIMQETAKLLGETI